MATWWDAAAKGLGGLFDFAAAAKVGQASDSLTRAALESAKQAAELPGLDELHIMPVPQNAALPADQSKALEQLASNDAIIAQQLANLSTARAINTDRATVARYTGQLALDEANRKALIAVGAVAGLLYLLRT